MFNLILSKLKQIKYYYTEHSVIKSTSLDFVNHDLIYYKKNTINYCFL